MSFPGQEVLGCNHMSLSTEAGVAKSLKWRYTTDPNSDCSRSGCIYVLAKPHATRYIGELTHPSLKCTYSQYDKWLIFDYSNRQDPNRRVGSRARVCKDHSNK